MADTVDTLTVGIDAFERQLRDEIERRMVEFMAECEADAKIHHGYTDRSGDLTASIRGTVEEVTALLITATLSASGPIYANYIEHLKNGKYAFIRPTLERMRNRFRELFGVDLVFTDDSIPAGGSVK